MPTSPRGDAQPRALLPATAAAAPPPTETTAMATATATATVSDTRRPRKKPPKKKKLHLRTRELVRFRCQNLELDIMHLRQEIATLERARRLLYARTLNRADAPDGSVLRTIRQWYQVLRHGFREVVWLDDARPLDFRQFVYAAFDDVLALGPDPSQKLPSGRDQLVDHIAHMTALTGSPNVQMLDVEIYTASDNGTATVVVHTVCTSPLSVLMLEAKFAHVALYPELKAKLVGRTISAYGDARYVFDLKTGRIVSADIQADHAAAILEVVDTAEEYEILFDGRREAIFVEELATTPTGSPSQTASTPSTSDCAEARPRISPMSLDFVLSPDTSTVSDSEC